MTTAAGLLVFRQVNERIEVLIVHPGGPYFASKDKDVWSIPKGEIDDEEKPIQAACREFKEEVGIDAPKGRFEDLGAVVYPKNNKKIVAWAVEGNPDLSGFKSNTFEMQWPPRSGQKQRFPEVDKAEWHSLDSAAEKMFYPQVAFLERLAALNGIDFRADSQNIAPSQEKLL